MRDVSHEDGGRRGDGTEEGPLAATLEVSSGHFQPPLASGLSGATKRQGSFRVDCQKDRRATHARRPDAQVRPRGNDADAARAYTRAPALLQHTPLRTGCDRVPTGIYLVHLRRPLLRERATGTKVAFAQSYRQGGRAGDGLLRTTRQKWCRGSAGDHRRQRGVCASSSKLSAECSA